RVGSTSEARSQAQTICRSTQNSDKKVQTQRAQLIALAKQSGQFSRAPCGILTWWLQSHINTKAGAVYPPRRNIVRIISNSCSLLLLFRFPLSPTQFLRLRDASPRGRRQPTFAPKRSCNSPPAAADRIQLANH